MYYPTHHAASFFRLAFSRLNLSILFVLFIGAIWAQPTEILLDNGELLSTDEGLSSTVVYCLYEDSEGFIWVGTSRGVNRYDGHRFTSYSSKSIHQIVEDRNNVLWLLKSIFEDERFVNQIILLNPTTGATKTVADIAASSLILNKNVLSLSQDDDENLWFCTNDGEVYKYDGEEFQLIYKNETGEAILKVVSPQLGELVMLEKDSLFRWTEADGLLEKKPLPEEMEYLWSGAQGRVYMAPYFFTFEDMGAKEDGSLTLGDKPMEIYYQESGLPVQQVQLEGNANEKRRRDRVFGKIGDRKLWYFGRDDMHVYDQNGKLLRSYLLTIEEKRKLGLDFKEKIYSGGAVVYGKDGTLWIGNPSGLLKFSNKTSDFQKLLHQPPGKTLSVRGMVEIDSAYLLACTYDFGVLKVNRQDQSQQPILQKDLNLPAFGYGMTTDANGDIWIGSHVSTIYKYNEAKSGITLRLDLFNLDVATQLQIPYYDHVNGRLWIGAIRYGLYYFDYEKQAIVRFEKWGDKEELRDIRIYCFFQNDEKLWLGTNKGIFIIDPAIGVIDRKQDIPLQSIKRIHHTNDGNIWMAGDGGLVRWDPTTNEQKLFTTNDGFSDNYLYNVVEDEFGCFWLPSNKGLMRFNPETYQVNTFLPSAGIAHEEFNFASFYQDDKGLLYFGGLNGFTVFDPKDFATEKLQSPAIKLTEVNLYYGDSKNNQNGPIDFRERNEIEYLPAMKNIQFNFALQDYSMTNKQTYAYKIEGVDPDWIFIRENSLRFNQLPYGRYNLLIKGTGGKGVWSKPLVVPLKVVRPFYTTWWFILAMIFLGLYLVRMFIRWRVRNLENEVAKRTKQIEEGRKLIENQYKELEEMNRTKDRLYGIIAHDLRDPVIAFKGIAAKINFLIKKNQPQRVYQLAEYVEESAGNLSNLLENLLSWAQQQRGDIRFRPSSHKFESLFFEVFNSLKLFAATKDIQLKYKGDSDVKIYGDYHMLSATLRNLTHNAIKFSHANSTVEIVCQLDMGRTVFTITDNGVGIPADRIAELFKVKTKASTHGTAGEKGTGLGLVLCRDLVDKHHGKLEVKSREGGPTIFTVSIPSEENKS